MELIRQAADLHVKPSDISTLLPALTHQNWILSNDQTAQAKMLLHVLTVFGCFPVLFPLAGGGHRSGALLC